MSNAVTAQNDSLKAQNAELESRIRVEETNYRQTAQMRNTLRIVNNFLLFFYAFIFTLIHVMYGVQYWNGIPRNEWVDSVMLTVFFVYPYLIYSIEAYIYDFIAALAKLFLGTSYIPSLDLVMGNLSKFDMPPNSTDFQ
jgi:hypothetical protein